MISSVSNLKELNSSAVSCQGFEVKMFHNVALIQRVHVVPVDPGGPQTSSLQEHCPL